MKISKLTIAGISIAVPILLSSLFVPNEAISFFIMGIAVIVGAGPIVLGLIRESNKGAEKEEMFLEFARNLVESVKTGTPISKSIINLKDKSYGPLSIHVKKLANQIYLGIPFSIALETFSKDVDNKAISRALTLMGQAEKSGGDIVEILESVANAVNMSDKLKKERRASISTLVVQGYLIFFIFIIIILIMQFKIIPMLSGLSGNINIGGGTQAAGAPIDTREIANSFLYLLLIQGFFSGITIGQLSEGNLKSGIKHSAALMLASFFISAGANLIFG